MLLLLLNFLLPLSFAGHSFDLPCDAFSCVIPYDKEGNQNGTEVCYEDETRVEKIREITWKDGKREGLARCWKKGKQTFEATYRNDVLNGLYIDFDDDSNGDRVVLLENNEETGLSFSVKNGKVTDLNHCIVGGTRVFDATLSCDDKDYGRFNAPLAVYKKEMLEKNKAAAAKEAKRQNGPQESKYSSGQIRAKWTNVNGNIHGKFLSYRENGKVQNDCEYKNGKEHGTCLIYDDEGRLDKREQWDNGKKTDMEEFYDNGKPERMSKNAGPGRSCITEYYDTGVKSGEWCGLQDRYWSWWVKRDGPHKIWHENGEIYSQGNYVNGEEEGLFTYHIGNVLERELTYEKGRLMKSIEYHNDPPQHRMVREYFPDGSVKSESKLEGLKGDGKKMI
ncbi:MAG: hypothetical protein V4598_00575 [Bdellovibrionota bacterium]